MIKLLKLRLSRWLMAWMVIVMLTDAFQPTTRGSRGVLSIGNGSSKRTALTPDICRNVMLSSANILSTKINRYPYGANPLFAAPGGLRSPGTGGSSGKRPPRKNPIARVLKKALSFQIKLYTRIQSLSKKAKRVLAFQIFLFSFAFGSVSNKIYHTKVAPPPIEIAYSSFLELVDSQREATNSASSETAASNVPRIDRVRIGSDKILYRLHSSQAATAAAAETPPAETEQIAPSKKGRFQNRLSQRFSLGTGKHSKQKVKSQPPFVNAYTRKVPASPELMSRLLSNSVPFSAAPAPRTSPFALTLRAVMISFYFLILYRLYQTVNGAAGGGKKEDMPGKLASSDNTLETSFDEIQGIDFAKQEVLELVDTIINPEKYSILGARAPRGLLLAGPPGTGKTLLARATAAATGVPFVYCSGSDFVEMFVGRGAARVRNLFTRAQALAPCLIFIDELDALGKSRAFGGPSSMMGGGRGNDEAEQTLNQLLACMDGLDNGAKNQRICVMAATNRKDVLDPALLRPGRFDRIVQLELPNAAGREAILRVHAEKLPGFSETSGVDPNRPGALGKGAAVDLTAVAAVTEGLSGAELEFLVNEAAIRAVRRVSDALRQGADSGSTSFVPPPNVTPHVSAADFESSVANFFATRRQKGGVDQIFKNMLK